MATNEQQFLELVDSVKESIVEIQNLYNPFKEARLTFFDKNGTEIDILSNGTQGIPLPEQILQNGIHAHDDVKSWEETYTPDFTSPLEPKNDENATTNYIAEPYTQYPESTSEGLAQTLNILPDSTLIITSIIISENKKVVLKFAHGFRPKDLKLDQLPQILDNSYAAPTLTIHSKYRGPSMFKSDFDECAAQMTPLFYTHCHTVKIYGLFNSIAISKLTDTIPNNVKTLIMIKLKIAGGYRLEYPMSNKNGLQRLRFDCRVTEQPNMDQNVFKLKQKLSGHALLHTFLNVTGFPQNAYKFGLIENNIVQFTQDGGTCTLLTEEHLDDTILGILQSKNYTFVRLLHSKAAFYPFDSQRYRIFNKIAQRHTTITLGFLQRNA